MLPATRPGRVRRLVAGLALAAVATATGAAGTAYATTATPPPSAPAQAQELVATPAIGPVGTETLVQLRGWPAGATVQVSTCGNNALNGNADCDNAGSISATTSADGTFTVVELDALGGEIAVGRGEVEVELEGGRHW